MCYFGCSISVGGFDRNVNVDVLLLWFLRDTLEVLPRSISFVSERSECLVGSDDILPGMQGMRIFGLSRKIGFLNSSSACGL